MNVRADTGRTLETIEAYFAAHIAAPRDGAARYSVRLGKTEAGTQRPLHQLFDAACLVLRTEYPEELLTALAHLVSDHADHGNTPLRARALTLVDASGRAALLPPYLRKDVATFERHLTDAGLRVVRAPAVSLIPGGADLIVPDAAVTVDDRVTASLRTNGASPTARGSVEPGRYRVGTCILHGEGEALASLSPATAVPKLMNLLDPDSTADMETALETLTAVARSADLRITGIGHARDVLEAIRRHLTAAETPT